MSATNALETGLLNLLFPNSNYANVGDATGLRGSTVAGVFYISLHTADPGETGNQGISETTYTNYTRISVARSGAGWSVSGGTVSNVAAITFPTCGVTGATITHFGIGSDVSGAGNLFLYGPLTAPFIVTTGLSPTFLIGTLSVTLD